MARVEVGAQEFGTIIRNGQPVPNATVQIATLAGPAATHWSAVTGGSSSTANLSTDVDGVVGLGGAARFVDEGTYNLTSGGTTRRVEAVSGATLVSAESRLVDVAVNVTDATGATEVTTQIQALIDGSPVNTIFDFGSAQRAYKVDSLVPKTGHTYRGDGARLIQKAGATNAIIYHAQASPAVDNITVKGLRFEGAGQADTPVVRQGAVRIDRGTDIRIEDCHAQDFADSGFMLIGIRRGYIVNNTVLRCCSTNSRNGIHVAPYGSSTDATHGVIVVQGNLVDDCATAGICVQSTVVVRSRVSVVGNVVINCPGWAGIALEGNGFLGDVTVTGNHTHACLTGIVAKDTSGASGATDPEKLRHFVITGNLIDCDTIAAAKGVDVSVSQAVVANNVIRASGFAILAYGETATTPDRRIHGLALSGNVISCSNTGTVSHIVQLAAADYCTIRGNHISLETGATSASGIRVASDTIGCSVLGNSIVGVSRNGIETTDMKDGTISGNFVLNSNVENAGYDGIRAGGATNKGLLIVNNTVLDNRGTALMRYGVDVSGITAANPTRTSPNTIQGMLTRDTSAATVANISLGGSPHTYQNTDGHDMDVIVQGGTVSSVDVSRDNTNWYATGATAGMFHVGPNEYIRVTYSVAPTVRRVPRPG